MKPKEKKQNTGIIILAVIAVLALVIAWIASDGTSEDALPAVTDESQEAVVEIEAATEQATAVAEVEAEKAVAAARLAAARVEAQAEIASVEARVEAGEEYEDLVGDIDAIQADLAVAYENASAEAQVEWEEMQSTFAELEQGLRDGAGDVLEYFAALSLSLETDVRAEEADDLETSENEI